MEYGTGNDRIMYAQYSTWIGGRWFLEASFVLVVIGNYISYFNIGFQMYLNYIK